MNTRKSSQVEVPNNYATSRRTISSLVRLDIKVHSVERNQFRLVGLLGYWDKFVFD